MAIVLILIGSGIWGFVAVAMGVSGVWVGLGAVVIGAGVLVQMFGDKNSHDSN